MVLHHMFSALAVLRSTRDDDFVDRLSYFYTSSMLISMAVLVSFKQFGGKPLECWTPPEFTPSMNQYTEMFCWSQNTYFVPFRGQGIPLERNAFRSEQQVSYYQWVPFFLLLEALIFYLPCMIWRMTNDKSDYYMTALYMVIKVLYITNILVNLLLLNRFLQTDKNSNSIYGWDVLRDLMNNKGWQESGFFPRVTYCDFQIRTLGNIHSYTVQCVLVINIFNEKIFILLWLWLSFLLIATVMDSIYWLNISVRYTDRFRFIMRHLELKGGADSIHLSQKPLVQTFLNSYIKVDGVFVLRMMALHAGVMICQEMTETLWKRFLEKNERHMDDEHSN